MPFSFAFSIASRTASSTSSTPQTSPASRASASAIVPMPQNRSSTFSRPLERGELGGRCRRATSAISVFVWKNASGEIRKRRPDSSSSSTGAPLTSWVSPPRVVSATPSARVQRNESAGVAAASSATRNSPPGLVTTRAWTWPVRRPSRTTRLRSTPVPRLAVPRGETLLAAPRLDRLADLVDALGGEDVVLHVVDQVPAAGVVEAEHELALLVHAERVLELVAVAQLLLRRHDRLDRRVLESADAAERVAHLRLLLLELALVRAAPARARRGAAPPARCARDSAPAARPARPRPTSASTSRSAPARGRRERRRGRTRRSRSRCARRRPRHRRDGRPSARARHPSGDADVWLPGRLPRRPMVAGPFCKTGYEPSFDSIAFSTVLRFALRRS